MHEKKTYFLSFLGGKITHRYNAALLGFAAEIPDDSVRKIPFLWELEKKKQATAILKPTLIFSFCILFL